MSGDTVQVQCPYCYEALEIWIDPDVEGAFVQDCDVCCRPWQVSVEHSGDGEPPMVSIDRAQ